MNVYLAKSIAYVCVCAVKYIASECMSIQRSPLLVNICVCSEVHRFQYMYACAVKSITFVYMCIWRKSITMYVCVGVSRHGHYGVR
ncbi:hypothetical protein BDD12DRAFT_171992 [Trichophaea hybrida]|nr:hypothetical protein BDD12DRAFT_171992 [Trichophaea hybrida]